MCLVDRFGISEEGATYYEAYSTLEKMVAAGKDELLLRLIVDERLVASKSAIISHTVAFLNLDAEAREDIAALPERNQVEILSRLLKARERPRRD